MHWIKTTFPSENKRTHAENCNSSANQKSSNHVMGVMFVISHPGQSNVEGTRNGANLYEGL